ncbi:MAG: GGDEF domain-containing protein [Thiomonas sp.]|uniref:GGDEF domain-containing protein n=1 Tax=Thiomonas sp. TaxID=2047785 RepID=UPI002A368197|nr:GGDEF domain-containing protein [Thiomonas sp.]MDY0331376.1 GGDEF domain-containing protein [Thiomonas sp.]
MCALALSPTAEPKQPSAPTLSVLEGGLIDASPTQPETGAAQEASALRLARQIYVAWFQRCLRQGVCRNHPGAVVALPRGAIEHQLDQVIDCSAPDAAELLPPLDAQQRRLAEICSLISELTATDQQHARAVQTWDRLIDLGLDTLQGFADLEVLLAARRAAQDALTGLPGRAALQRRLQGEQALVLRQGGMCSVVMLDIDHFKRVNDQHGHQTGDRVLAAFARLLRGALRPYDGVYRYGGEEFVLVLPGATAVQAVQIVDRMRQALAQRPLVQTRTGGLHIGFSAGVAALTGRAIAQTLRCADLALYCAKAQGRDQVRLEPGHCA